MEQNGELRQILKNCVDIRIINWIITNLYGMLFL